MHRKASDSTLEQKLFMSPSATISQVATRLLGFHSFQYLNGPMTLQKKIDHEFMGTFGQKSLKMQTLSQNPIFSTERVNFYPNN